MTLDKMAGKIARKRLKHSMTVHINALLGLLTALLVVLETQFHLLKGFIGEKWWPVAFVALTMINVALRYKTERAHVRSNIKG